MLLREPEGDCAADNTGADHNHVVGAHGLYLTQLEATWGRPGRRLGRRGHALVSPLERLDEFGREDLRLQGEVACAYPVVGEDGFMCLGQKPLHFPHKVGLRSVELLTV